MDMIDNPNYYFVERPYKSKYICINCRKVFKRRVLSDITNDKKAKKYDQKCPDCGKTTSWIGPKFRAPKSDDIKAWNSIKILNDIGAIKFLGFANIKVNIPKTKKSLDDLLIQLKTNFEKSLNQWEREEYNPEIKDHLKYYSDLIQKIDKHLLT